MPKLSFSENERVLCYHGPLIYEAKVLKSEGIKSEVSQDRGAQYFVHYKGWKQSWDEWVGESRLMKLTEENLRKQRELNEARRVKDIHDKLIIKDSKINDVRTMTTVDKTKKAEGRGTKRNRDMGYEPEDENPKKPSITIMIPEPLKLQLVDDWEAVTRKNQSKPSCKNTKRMLRRILLHRRPKT